MLSSRTFVGYVFAILLASSLANCSKQVSLDDTLTHKTEESSEVLEVPIAFNFSIGGTSTTRASISEEELLASTKLLTVQNLRMVIYNLSDENTPTTVAYSFDREFEIFRGKATGSDLKNFDEQTKTITFNGTELIKMGNYAVVYFTSPPMALKEVTSVGKEFSELQKAIKLDRLYDDNEGHLRSTIYSNCEEPLILSEKELRENGPSKVFTLKTARLKALNALFYFTSDNKVLDEKYFIPNNGFICPYVTASNLTLIPKPSYQKVIFNDDTYALIPEDDNFDTSSMGEAELSSHFYYFDDEEHYRINLFNFTSVTSPNPRAGYGMAVPENTVAVNSISSRSVTQIVLKVPIYPIELKEALGETISETAVEESWLDIKGKYYLLSQFRKLVSQAQKTPSGERTDEQLQLIEAAKDLYAKAKGVDREKFDDSSKFQVPQTNFRSENVTFYYSGMSYFSFPVRHYSDERQPNVNEGGRYGIVRNTLYYYHIESYPTIGAALYSDLDKGERKYEEELEVSSGSITIANPEVIKTTISL